MITSCKLMLPICICEVLFHNNNNLLTMKSKIKFSLTLLYYMTTISLL